MFLTRISVNAPVFATMVMAALMVIGSYSFMRLPIEQLPDVDFPVVAVVVSYPGAAPEAVESDIIEPIEESVNTISGIDYIESTARAGEALVILFFEMDVDSGTAMQEVRDGSAPSRRRSPRTRTTRCCSSSTRPSCRWSPWRSAPTRCPCAT